MGCDIHLFTEVRKNTTSPWCLVAPTWPCQKCSSDPDECIMRKVLDNEINDCYWCGGGGVTTYYTRNYYLFGQLAGVRYDIEPFIKVRGWPDDLSQELRLFVESDDRNVRNNLHKIYNEYPGDHTEHYYTLEELLTASLYIDEKTIENFDKEKVSYRDSAKDFWNSFVPHLQTLGPPENVRIIFNFDS